MAFHCMMWSNNPLNWRFIALEVKLDSLDIRIVEALQRDASLTNAELADRVHSTPSTCLRRVQRLVDAGVLSRSVFLADASKLGRGLKVVITVTTKDHRRADRDVFAKSIACEPAISLAYGVTGGVDAVLIGNFRDLAEYQDTCDRLFDNVESIVRYTTHFITETYKDEPAVPCDAVDPSVGDRA